MSLYLCSLTKKNITSNLQELLQLPPLRQRKGAPNGVGLGKGHLGAFSRLTSLVGWVIKGITYYPNYMGICFFRGKLGDF